jgi:hypothetical protein
MSCDLQSHNIVNISRLYIAIYLVYAGIAQKATRAAVSTKEKAGIGKLGRRYPEDLHAGAEVAAKMVQLRVVYGYKG